ncbi:DNA-binding transcriptional regulator LsrR, DeoR family [Paramicrobacterium humi]|uniref:DNA-binding transcriptional regulator LsrR, DeoR family n=2 Tax=Paramicrobacterium humi TaxID=640635 RepID=A0A1H4KVW9_9MICO|nr:DNA-binding transcriptional regulator LsrR, DeoR family [Microbacterium humi]
MALVVARKFYLEDHSKVEIADELQISRFKVARLIEQARSLGLITISINDEGLVDEDLSARVAAKLGIDEARVIEAYGDDTHVRDQVGKAAGELLTETLRPGDVLGMAWGRTLSSMTESLPSLPPMTIVQLTGAAGMNIFQSPVELVRKLVQASGGSAYPIYAPLVLADPTTAEALRSQPDIARALSRYSEVTTAVMSIGSWQPPESQLYESIHPDDRQGLLDRGVVAEISGVLLAEDGSEPAPDFLERCICATAAELRAIPRVLAVAAGARKAAAVRAVARAGLMNGLVTDRTLAEAVLALPDS